MRTALDSILDGHEPYPAVVVDRLGDLVAGNRAFAALVCGSAPVMLEPPVFVARVLLHPDGLGSRIRNFNEWAFHVVDAFGRQLVRYPDDALPARDTEIAALAGDRPVTPVDHLGFAVPLGLDSPDGVLRLMTTLTSFSTAIDVTLAELRLEAFLPADAATALALARLAEPGERG